MAEGGKTFYEDTTGGPFKFVKLDDVVYYVTKGDSLCCNIAGSPPASCNQCGRTHWIWDCPDLWISEEEDPQHPGIAVDSGRGGEQHVPQEEAIPKVKGDEDTEDHLGMPRGWPAFRKA